MNRKERRERKGRNLFLLSPRSRRSLRFNRRKILSCAPVHTHSAKVFARFPNWWCDSHTHRLTSVLTRPRKFLPRSRRVSPKPLSDSCRWFTTNFAISPPPSLPVKLPDKPSRPPPWCTRHGSSLLARIVGSGRGAPISSLSRPRPCAASLLTTL